jgi:hypothetical protein
MGRGAQGSWPPRWNLPRGNPLYDLTTWEARRLPHRGGRGRDKRHMTGGRVNIRWQATGIRYRVREESVPALAKSLHVALEPYGVVQVQVEVYRPNNGHRYYAKKGWRAVDDLKGIVVGILSKFW